MSTKYIQETKNKNGKIISGKIVSGKIICNGKISSLGKPLCAKPPTTYPAASPS